MKDYRNLKKIQKQPNNIDLVINATLNTKVRNIKIKIPDIIDLVIIHLHHTKVTKIEYKIRDATNLVNKTHRQENK